MDWQPIIPGKLFQFAPGVYRLVPPRHRRRPEVLQGVLQHPNHGRQLEGLEPDSIEKAGQILFITSLAISVARS